jgi:hypothetical protein
MGREMLRITHWTALWPAFFGTTVVGITSFRRSAVPLLTMMVIGPFVVYAGAFILSAWPNYQEHMAVVFPRLLFSMAPTAWLATLLYLHDTLQPDRLEIQPSASDISS